jgi:hypothetical protein
MISSRMVLPPATCQLYPVSYMLILAPLESLIVGKGIGKYGRARKGETRQNNKQGKDVPPYTVMPYLESPSSAQTQT